MATWLIQEGVEGDPNMLSLGFSGFTRLSHEDTAGLESNYAPPNGRSAARWGGTGNGSAMEVPLAARVHPRTPELSSPFASSCLRQGFFAFFHSSYFTLTLRGKGDSTSLWRR